MITTNDWYPVGGGESGYIAPKPGDPNIVIAGTYTGTMTRYDVRTKQTKDISVWLNNYDGWAARDVPNRFQWTYPIVYSTHDPRVLYSTANRVFRSTERRKQLGSRSAPTSRVTIRRRSVPSGGPITYDMTGTEWYATIFAFAESPLHGRRPVGGIGRRTDSRVARPRQDVDERHAAGDGEVHARLDHRAVALRCRRRRTSPPTATSSTTSSRTSSRRPTYGKTWTRDHDGHSRRRVHAHHSRRSGAARAALRRHRDRRLLLDRRRRALGSRCSSIFRARRCAISRFTAADLIAATHGRAMWVLDDVSPLRQLADSVRNASVHLFAPDTAIRFAGGSARTHVAGENPPAGVIVDYWLKTAAIDPRDSASARVRRRERQGDSSFLERAAARLGQVRRVRAHDCRLGARRRARVQASSPATRCRNKSRGSRELPTTRWRSRRAIRS